MSIPVERKWEYVRFKTKPKLYFLQLLLGPYSTIGVKRDWPSKINNYMIALNLNNSINIVEHVEDAIQFSRCNLTEFSVDVIHFKEMGAKV